MDAARTNASERNSQVVTTAGDKPSFDLSDEPLDNVHYEEDFRTGMEYFEKSQYKMSQLYFERSQFPPSYVMMGILYLSDGRIGPKDPVKCKYWFDMAKEHSNFFLNLELSSDALVLFTAGLYFYDVEKNTEMAMKFFQGAADKGLSCAQSRIARFLQIGEGVEKDITKAIHYYKMSADQGNSRAQSYLGTSFLNGDGVEKDESKAVHYFKLAADQGSAVGQYSLAQCFEKGVGVEKDMTKAIHYYQLSADQGNTIAKSSLELCKV
jgi:TPR repeat protein